MTNLAEYRRSREQNSNNTMEHPWPALIVENLSYIEKQCHKAVARYGRELYGGDNASDIALENAADELFNDLLDRLSADNFQALQNYKGTAKITTYLTTIISNLIIDIMRAKKGRSRSKDRAKEFGMVGEHLYEAVYGRGFSIPEAQEFLAHTHGIRESEAVLLTMLTRIRGNDGITAPVGDGCCPMGSVVGDEDEYEIVVPDPAPNPEQRLAECQRNKAAEDALGEVLQSMEPEERLMVRMRYPADEDEPGCKLADIARRLNLTEKVVESRLRRTLLRCRELLMGRGLRPDDLIEI